jgi:hypothetical protein
MPSSLWLLMKLRLKGWARRLTRNLQTVKGAVFTTIFGVFAFACITIQIVNVILQPASNKIAAEQVERFGPLGMLVYCIGMILLSGTQSPITFSPAEVQFLFAGPFSRRQILAYKMLTQFLMTVPISIFLSITMRGTTGVYLSGLVAIILILLFLQLFGIAVNLIASTIGELAYSRGRQAVLILLLIALIVATLVGWRAGGGLDNPVGTLERIEQSDVVQYGLMPFRWFFRALAARSLDGRFFLDTALAFLVDATLLILVFALDARYLESAAANSEKRYARLERLRRGGLASLGSSQSKPVRFRIPDPHWLGGFGPIAWRQFVTATRTRRAVTLIVIITLMASIGPLTATLMNKDGTDQALPWTIASMGLFMSMMMSQAMGFDFRSDVDRMEVLKSLPIPAWRIVVGQMIVPVIFLSIYQIAITGVIYLGLGKIGILLMFVSVLAWPVNLLLVGIDNLFFLLFPTRMQPANPGDFSQAGRHMLLMLGKAIGAVIGLGLPATFGAVTYLLAGRNWSLTLLAAFVPAVMVCALPIPLVTLAFRRYDVARDTPA